MRRKPNFLRAFEGCSPIAQSSFPNSDDGQEATGKSTFFAVAEKEIAAAGGAEIADEDVLGAEAGVEELRAIGFAEVEQDIFRRGLVARRHPIQPLDWIGLIAGAELIEPFGGIGKLRLKLDGDFGAHFVAATANRGADGGEEISGLGAEVHLHLADGFGGNASESAAPTGMNGRYSASFGVDEKNWDAVGGLHAEEQAGAVCGGGVTSARLGRGGVEKMDYVGMDLLERNEFEVRRAESGLEAAAVFQDVFASVPFGEAEIQHLLAIHGADAAGAGAEAVDEPGNFGERGHLKDLNAADFAFDPVRAGSAGRDRQECLSYWTDLAFGL